MSERPVNPENRGIFGVTFPYIPHGKRVRLLGYFHQPRYELKASELVH